MLYALFIFAVFVTVLYFTAPEFILRHKFRGEDLYKILSEEEHNHPLKLFGRGLHALLYSLVYYQVSLIAVPLIIIWAISQNIGFRVVSLIAAVAVIVLLLQFVRWLWQVISSSKGKADIQTDDEKQYRGKLISEDKIVKVDVIVPDISKDICIKGALLDEDEIKMTLLTTDGVQNVYKDSLDLKKLKRETVFNAEIELDDGTRKIGRKIYILGKKPFKDFLKNLPDLIIVLYLWYLVILFLTASF